MVVHDVRHLEVPNPESKSRTRDRDLVRVECGDDAREFDVCREALDADRPLADPLFTHRLDHRRDPWYGSDREELERRLVDPGLPDAVERYPEGPVRWNVHIRVSRRPGVVAPQPQG